MNKYVILFNYYMRLWLERSTEEIRDGEEEN